MKLIRTKQQNEGVVYFSVGDELKFHRSGKKSKVVSVFGDIICLESDAVYTIRDIRRMISENIVSHCIGGLLH